jgi:hypothetical protein
VRPPRLILFWVTIIALLLFVEVAELTHLFSLPLQSSFGNLLSFIFALVFTTILALVGAIFIGIYISHRLLSPSGFTPFEEEMLKMRSDVFELRRRMESLERPPAGLSAPNPDRPERN